MIDTATDRPGLPGHLFSTKQGDDAGTSWFGRCSCGWWGEDRSGVAHSADDFDVHIGEELLNALKKEP